MVIGGVIGHYMGKSPQFEFLTISKKFGIDEPVVLELGIICLKLGITLDINVASVIGMALGGLAFKKLQ